MFINIQRLVQAFKDRRIQRPRVDGSDDEILGPGVAPIDRREKLDLKSFKLGDRRGKHRRVRMADEGQQSEQAPKERKVLRHLPMLIKVLEIVLAIFAVGLIVDPLNSFQQIYNKPRFRLDDVAIIYITIGGYIVINTLFVTSHVLGDRIPKRTLILFASAGVLFHIVAGSVLVHNWRKMQGHTYSPYNSEIYPSKQYMDMMISGAVFTFMIAVVLTVEILTIIRYSVKH
ncbi:hypothetical protein KM043_011705 [Ampulex compressa]|nr:hypothetical protein KM043_011705 [Ampulex compressa]